MRSSVDCPHTWPRKGAHVQVDYVQPSMARKLRFQIFKPKSFNFQTCFNLKKIKKILKTPVNSSLTRVQIYFFNKIKTLNHLHKFLLFKTNLSTLRLIFIIARMELIKYLFFFFDDFFSAHAMYKNQNINIIRFRI